MKLVVPAYSYKIQKATTLQSKLLFYFYRGSLLPPLVKN